MSKGIVRVYWKDGTCNKALPMTDETTVQDFIDLCKKKFDFYIQQNPIEVDATKYMIYTYIEEDGGEVVFSLLSAKELVKPISTKYEGSASVFRFVFLATTDSLPSVKQWKKPTKFVVPTLSELSHASNTPIASSTSVSTPSANPSTLVSPPSANPSATISPPSTKPPTSFAPPSMKPSPLVSPPTILPPQVKPDTVSDSKPNPTVIPPPQRGPPAFAGRIIPKPSNPNTLNEDPPLPSGLPPLFSTQSVAVIPPKRNQTANTNQNVEPAFMTPNPNDDPFSLERDRLIELQKQLYEIQTLAGDDADSVELISQIESDIAKILANLAESEAKWRIGN